MFNLIEKEKLPELIKTLREENKIIVTTNGCFDLLHVGHVRYLQKSKSYGDILIVMLNSDNSVKRLKGETRPLNNEKDRAEILCALSCVDYVVIFDEDTPKDLLDIIKPDIHTKGGDYTLDTLPEADVIKKNNIKLELITFVKGKSTTNIINKMNNKS